MNVINFWLTKSNEKNVLKVVEWAHRQGIQIETITNDNIAEALKTYLRDSSHS